MDWYFIGVDFGQTRDYTAIALLERAEVKGEFDYGVRAYARNAELRLRHLERIPLGTPYPEIVDRVVKLTQDRRLSRHCHLAVDGTGVGRPVVDLLRKGGPEAVLMPVTITGGQTESANDGFYRVPKRDLIVGLQVILQNGGLQIAEELDFGRKLAEEMVGMEVRISPAGNEQFAAWREGTHDDLVFAVALAYWAAGRYASRERDRWWLREEVGAAENAFRAFLRENRSVCGG